MLHCSMSFNCWITQIITWQLYLRQVYRLFAKCDEITLKECLKWGSCLDSERDAVCDRDVELNKTIKPFVYIVLYYFFYSESI